MGTENRREYVTNIGISKLLWNTQMGNKIYSLNNGQKYKKFCADYGDLRQKVNYRFKERLLEQTEEYGHPIICFPETIISSEKWLSGMVTDFANGNKLKDLDLTTQIDYLLYLVETLEEGIADVSIKGWVFEDLHEENILVDLANEKDPIKIIDTDFYSKDSTEDPIIRLQIFKDNLVRIFDAIMITILPHFDNSLIWNAPKIQDAYLKATSGDITCSEFLKTLLVTLKMVNKKDQNILTLRKSVNQLWYNITGDINGN